MLSSPHPTWKVEPGGLRVASGGARPPQMGWVEGHFRIYGDRLWKSELCMVRGSDRAIPEAQRLRKKATGGVLSP